MLLTTPEDAIRAAHRVADVWAPGVLARDRAGAAVVPHDELRALDTSGLLGITVPARFGGPGLGPSTLAEVVRTLAAVDPALAQVPQGHYLMVDVLAVCGPETARNRLYADVLAGRRLGNALAERGGRHAQDLTTRLTGSRVTGTKYYCTGALTAAWIAVSALDDDARLRLAFVARDAAGLTVDTDWNVMGQRATISGTTTFDAVDVDPDLVVDYAGAYAVPQQLGARAQLVHAAIEVGIAGGALRDTREYLRTRARPATEAVRYGAADVAGDPHVLHRYGRLDVRVRAAEALLARAAADLDEIGLVPADAAAAARGSLSVAAAKAFGSEVAVEAGSELFALAGASAADERWDLHRHWRNARTHSVHDPVDWKYHHIGGYEVGGVLPPSHGQL
ncbi:acyl-CoA dehydrogenase family protein [Jidongwangia harbinensis]|uniref:acyl-CoA dehydrogenase family protein n=1 Tax=Jidongwangia harbinensis TaxID=2878561 RepID=UPI001CD959C2|nr:acyl-CoA dehydrogenase family protein [Jidongwangia harbinensis]MCA2216594.1 acyl-CoA dehydrogenase family protein [Jidongwangia harbinensis]